MTGPGRLHLALAPGEQYDLELTVTNTSEFVDAVVAEVVGVDQDWVRRPVPRVNLLPTDTGTLPIRLAVPKDGEASRYEVEIRARSLVDDRTVSDEPLCVDLDVARRESGVLKVSPSLVNGGSSTTVDATVVNTGNCDLRCTVSVEDSTKVLDLRVEPPSIMVPRTMPGAAESDPPTAGSASTAIRIRGPRPWFGSAVPRTLVVAVRGEVLDQRAVITFNQKPRIPRGVLTALLLAGVVALWAFVFLGAARILAPKDPTKTATNLWNTEEEASAAAVTASVSGTLRSPVDIPLSRITVEAYRIPVVRTAGTLAARAGSSRPLPAQQPAPAATRFGSAATDEDGRFTIGGLPPGSYVFRMSGPGFAPAWFPPQDPTAAQGVPEPAGASAGADGTQRTPPAGLAPRRLAPQQRTPFADQDQAAKVAGQPGRLQARIRTPEGLIPSNLDIQLVQIPPDTAEDQTPVPVTSFVYTSADGTFDATGLATPASYALQITSTINEYLPTVVPARMRAGEQRDLGEVRLAAGPGTILGTVQDEAGNPLGDAVVRVDSGELVRTARTPTSGPTQGRFLLSDLPTPRTYVISISRDGYQPRSITVPLVAGRPLDFDAPGQRPIRLVGGTATATGVVLDPFGAPLGGVQVSAVRGDFQAATTSLTDGLPADVGSFRVSGLVSDATYVVSFTKDGYLPETQAVRVDASGRTAPLEVRMRFATAVITGRVVGQGGEPLADVDVQLTDGVKPRITRTASDPPGGYTIDGVGPGTYTITFSAEGYIPFRAVIPVLPPGTIERNVTLVRR